MNYRPTYSPPSTRHRRPRGLAASLFGMLIALSACTPAGVSLSSGERSIDITRIAKVSVVPGTSKVLGTVRLPRAIVDGKSNGLLDDLVTVPGAVLRLVDENRQLIANTTSVTSDAGGVFAFPRVPLGTSMTLQAEVNLHGKTLRLSKVLRPTEALTCAHVDLATTLLADQLLSASPLLERDEALEGADLYNLFIPSRSLDVEAHVRSGLKQRPSGSLTDLLAKLTQGDTASLLGELAQQDSTLTPAYMNIFERPDSSLAINIRTSAIGTNSIGIEKRNLIFGVVTFKVVGAPANTARMEYWAKSTSQQKVAESTIRETWEASLDTWTLPDGDTTLDTVAILDNGKKVLVGRSYLSIQNTIANVCPLP